MKISKKKAAENRELILTSAAKLFRERGVPGVGVDALGQAAGMTHGSLYSQFGSKEKLLAEALDFGFERTGAMAARLNPSVEEAISRYLTPGHRDNPGSGCFMAALGGDMPRQGATVRSSFTRIVKGAAVRLGEKLPERRGTPLERQDEMLATVASMVGAMILARAVDDKEFSEHILSVTRSKLLKDLT
jgi:TetR/AcrR family transcriptional repressor of nem operon